MKTDCPADPTEEMSRDNTAHRSFALKKTASLPTQRMITMSEMTESELIAGFMKWVQANTIPIDTLTDDEMYEYVCRYIRAAG